MERTVPGFQLHKWAVTNEMYELFDPGHFSERWYEKKHPLGGEDGHGDDRCPVVDVTWYDAWCFAEWCGCRLPTDLEWEHACRAGSEESWCFGRDEVKLTKYAWYRKNANRHTHRVEELEANNNGMFDMHGNVWE